MKKTLKFINKICFEQDASQMVQDSIPYICKKCGEGAWLIDDIKHEKGCEVGIIKKEINDWLKVEK